MKPPLVIPPTSPRPIAWSDGKRMYRQTFAPDGDSLRPVGDVEVIATAGDTSNGHAPPPKPETNGCSSCGTGTIRPVQVVRFCGVRWFGEPKPKRLRLRLHWWPFTFADGEGCGCVVALKALAGGIALGIARARTHRAMVIHAADRTDYAAMRAGNLPERYHKRVHRRFMRAKAKAQRAREKASRNAGRR